MDKGESKIGIFGTIVGGGGGGKYHNKEFSTDQKWVSRVDSNCM